MARGRMIDRRISNSKKLGIVDDRARVLWIWLYVYTDKEGRVKFDDLDDLILECIPRFKDYSIKSVIKAIEDLDKVDLLVLYPFEDRLHPMAFALEFERFRDFQTIREDREEEEAKRAAQEEGEDETKELPTITTIIPEETKLEGFHVRKYWKWRVKDLSLIPRHYLMIDSATITAAVNALKEKTDIPGIEAYLEESISQSRGKQKDPY